MQGEQVHQDHQPAAFFLPIPPSARRNYRLSCSIGYNG
jgi:hypothetical protein